MSFQGADVSALDRLAQRTQQGADYARKIAIALKLVVAALRAMSWTGFAAAYAAYLENVVIPWVERTGDALERFANVLRMASAAQKSVSEDSPQISIPASAYHSPGMPAVSAANPPRLCLPETTVGNGDMPTVAEGAGAVIIVPVSLGATASTGVGGAKGPPLNVTLPIGPATVWNGQQRPGSSTGTPGSVSTPGPIGGTSGGWSGGGAGGGSSPVGGGSFGGGASGGSGSAGGSSFGGGVSGSGAGLGLGSGSLGGAGGSGVGLGGSGSAGGGSLGGGVSGSGAAFGSGSGSLGGAGSSGAGVGGGPLGSGSSSGSGSGAGVPGGGVSGGALGAGLGEPGRANPIASGNPSVNATPVSSGGALGSPQAATAPLHVVAGDSGGGANPAFLAAPIGLAGLGTAALGALKAKDARAAAVEEGDDD